MTTIIILTRVEFCLFSMKVVFSCAKSTLCWNTNHQGPLSHSQRLAKPASESGHQLCITFTTTVGCNELSSTTAEVRTLMSNRIPFKTKSNYLFNYYLRANFNYSKKYIKKWQRAYALMCTLMYGNHNIISWVCFYTLITTWMKPSNVVLLCPTCRYGDWQSKHNALFPIRSFKLERHDEFRQISIRANSGAGAQFWQYVLLHRFFKSFWRPPATLEFCVSGRSCEATESRGLCSAAPRTTHYKP